MSLENVPVDLPDFELVANMFVEEGVRVVSPSELHGLISGHLAAGARLQPTMLLQTACELLDIEALSHESSKVTLVNLYSASCEALESLDLDFEMLLPDDENEISQRADALGRWCQSFLSGFGLYGKHTDASLSSEAKETLTDLGQIAQISIELEELDENESDLMEVQEYVRMAVLMLFTECNKALENKEKAFAQVEPENSRLH
ncbi:UPF0149 family protein [Neptuniibacter pectenicola]|jgi:uncharacterized protein YgfB (UPF0149 family)|uniref:UPF0149 family protein n=1 Tax=Neptuniibacter pectenicola TaxID=1806669 RepID=A0ABU9TUP4_9GAMM|nr:UPF0149 family protein [Neptuniibacter pectenicola]KXJ51168.1 MAG: hypothetical protein AXW15_04860 [Neptuniibacter sp. Phe_28]|tara:strand:- start:177 stop:788 length:612 start_codon:yes stop_codon:yes gene_type:complete